MKEFFSSILFILSILTLVITAYLLYWTIVMPGWFVVPFLISLIIGLVTLFVSKRIGVREK